jgi:hypothetical protein
MLARDARHPQYGRHHNRMDRNVANANGNTYEKLAQHADRSGGADRYRSNK